LFGDFKIRTIVARDTRTAPDGGRQILGIDALVRLPSLGNTKVGVSTTNSTFQHGFWTYIESSAATIADSSFVSVLTAFVADAHV